MENNNNIELKKNLGQIIKSNRIKKKINQETLCEGICTSSYLSRIENGHLVADDQIYELLFKKLELDYHRFIYEDNMIDEKLEKIYKKLIFKEQIDEDIEVIFNSTNLNSKNVYTKKQLVYARYLINNDRVYEAKQIINEIKHTVSTDNFRNYFLFINISILINYIEGNYENILTVKRGFDKLITYNYEIKDYELGIYFYNVALTYCKLSYYAKCTHYAKNALDKFSNSFFPLFDFNCYLLLGIAFNNLSEFKKSLEYYELAKSILVHTSLKENQSYWNSLYCNIGYCYELQYQYEKAITYYEKALEYSEEVDVCTLINLTRSNYLFDKFDRASMYLNEIINSNIQIETKYKYQVDIFSIILFNQPDSLEQIDYLQKESINYFLNNKLYELTLFYCNVFAVFYKKLKWYKKVSELYEIAFKVSNMIRRGGKFNEVFL